MHSLKVSLLLSLFLLSILVGPWALQVLSQEESQALQPEENLLKLLGISPSAESIDYVQNKTQFQLHTLLTEQRHPKTLNLSYRIQKDSRAGLEMLFSVDEDIEERLESLDKEKLEQLVLAIEKALLEKNRFGLKSRLNSEKGLKRSLSER